MWPGWYFCFIFKVHSSLHDGMIKSMNEWLNIQFMVIFTKAILMWESWILKGENMKMKYTAPVSLSFWVKTCTNERVWFHCEQKHLMQCDYITVQQTNWHEKGEDGKNNGTTDGWLESHTAGETKRGWSGEQMLRGLSDSVHKQYHCPAAETQH